MGYAEEIQGVLLQGTRWGIDHDGRRGPMEHDLIHDQALEIIQQVVKGHDRVAFLCSPGVPFAVVDSLRLTIEQQWLPGFAQVPFDVVGQHAEEDVGTHPIRQMMVDGPDLQVHALQAPKGPFHLGQAVVVGLRIFGLQLGRRNLGAEHVDAVRRGFVVDQILIAPPGEAFF